MNIMIVSPHPDDETLGAGGSILKLKKEGHNVYWLNITCITKEMGFLENVIQKKSIQINKVKELLHIDKTYSLNLNTTKLGEYDSGVIIEKIGKIFDEVKPEMLILPDYNDAHSDHLYVFNWCFSASKIFRRPYIKKILTMEIVSETDFGKPLNPFIPNYFIDISNELEEKLEILRVYEEEMGVHPFPRSEVAVKSLATLRGSAAGVKYAEAFRVIKIIES